MSAMDDKMPMREARALGQWAREQALLDAASRGSSAGMARWLGLGASALVRRGEDSIAGLAAQSMVDQPGRHRLAALDLALEAMGMEAPAHRALATVEAMWTFSRQGRQMNAARLGRQMDWEALDEKGAGEMFLRAVEPSWREMNNHEGLDALALRLAQALGPSWRDEDGNGCLHWAALSGRTAMARALAAAGWSADDPGARGVGAWMSAADCLQWSTARELIGWADPRGRAFEQASIAPWAKSASGISLLDLARRRSAELDRLDLEKAAGHAPSKSGRLSL